MFSFVKEDNPRPPKALSSQKVGISFCCYILCKIRTRSCQTE